MPGIVSPSTQRLFGLDFVSDSTIEEVAEMLLAGAATPSEGWQCVVTPNVDNLVRYERYPEEAAVGRLATLVLPDGMPIVWASRLLRRPLRERLAGSDLFAALWPELAERGVPAVVVASGPEVAARLRAEHPTARVVEAPWFDVGDHVAVDALVAEVDAACREVGARFLFLGVAMPKHHLLAGRLAERWQGWPGSPVVVLMGASAGLYLGLTKRAPAWMQRAGLEWLHRLALDPRRLARRYLVDDPRFLRILWREWRGSRQRGAAPSEPRASSSRG